MFKFLLISFLFLFILFRVGGFFMRIFLGSMYNSAKNQRQKQQEDIHVNSKSKKSVSKSGYTGGEYVDYEEVD